MSKVVVPFNYEEEDDDNLWDAKQTERGEETISFDVESQEPVAENDKGGVSIICLEQFKQELEKKIQAIFLGQEEKIMQQDKKIFDLESQTQAAQARVFDLKSQTQAAQAEISELKSRLNILEKCN